MPSATNRDLSASCQIRYLHPQAATVTAAAATTGELVIGVLTENPLLVYTQVAPISGEPGISAQFVGKRLHSFSPRHGVHWKALIHSALSIDRRQQTHCGLMPPPRGFPAALSYGLSSPDPFSQTRLLYLG